MFWIRNRLIGVGAGAAGGLVVVLVLAALHGHGSAAPAATSQSPTPPGVVDAGSTDGAQPSASAASTANAGRASSTPAAPHPHATATAAASWFTVTLGSSCVVPAGTQTLVAQSRPGYTVAFNTRYADGSMGNAHGGYGVLPTDAQGRVTSSWTVSASAPLGTAIVFAGTASSGGSPTTLSRSFVVAAHC